LGVAAPLAWVAVVALPRIDQRWRAVRRIARTALAAMGVPVAVTGLDRLPRGDTVLVFNHLSYADALLLAAVLPGEPIYAANRELAGQIFAGPFLRRLGALFVKRYDVSASLADTNSAIAAAQHGRNIVFFPEGTFTRRAGLSEFYLGAFKVAAEAGLPIVPGIRRGTRSMLRSDQWFPRWPRSASKLPIRSCHPEQILRRCSGWGDAARKAVLARYGEPDLAELVKPAASSGSS
jgi:1-acyl-sn-glycerol-3-phosphate acyltransferase